ncbi:MAG: hypothetical protein WDW38_000768 [Sanguina aurantia]
MLTSSGKPLQHTLYRCEHVLAGLQLNQQPTHHLQKQQASSPRDWNHLQQLWVGRVACLSSSSSVSPLFSAPHSSRETITSFEGSGLRRNSSLCSSSSNSSSSSSSSSSSRSCSKTSSSIHATPNSTTAAINGTQGATSRSSLPTTSTAMQTAACEIAGVLGAAAVSYCFLSHAAAALQGVSLHSTSGQDLALAPPIRVSVQWDHMKAARQAVESHRPGPLHIHPGGYSSVTFSMSSPAGQGSQSAPVGVILSCVHNTVVAADPNRVQVEVDVVNSRQRMPAGSRTQREDREAQTAAQQQQQQQRHSLWAHSLAVLCHDPDASLGAAVCARLVQLQAELSALNSRSWDNDDAYGAWVVRFGPPGVAAAKIQQDPVARLSPLVPHLLDWAGPDSTEHSLELSMAAASGQYPHSGSTNDGGISSSISQPPSFKDQLVLNLMGSHGHKAVAMALLDANVIVVDVSQANARYGTELAAAAGVADRVRYAVCAELVHVLLDLDLAATDMLELPSLDLVAPGCADVVVAEQGILHYFVNLDAFMGVAAWCLKPGGRLVLRDFHPVSTKLLSSKGKKHKATGNYFNQDLVPLRRCFHQALHDSSIRNICQGCLLACHRAGTQAATGPGISPTGVVAAGAAALAVYVYRKANSRALEAPPADAQRPDPSMQHPEHPPNTWGEALFHVKEVFRYMYNETLGRWHTVDLFVGLAYLSHRDTVEYPAADIAARGHPISINVSEANKPALLAELQELRRYMLYCKGLKQHTVVVLKQQPLAGLLRPAYVLVEDKELRSVVLCIRGTHSMKDLFTTLAGAAKPHHQVQQHRVILGYSHLGMLAAARWMMKQITPALREAMKSRAGWKLRIVGHSMGGGTAALLTMMLRETVPELALARCYAIACPSCMTLELAQSCREYVTSVINSTDVVPTFSAAAVDALRQEVMDSSWFAEFQRDLRASVVKAVQGGMRGVGSATTWTARTFLAPAAVPFRSCYTRRPSSSSATATASALLDANGDAPMTTSSSLSDPDQSAAYTSDPISSLHRTSHPTPSQSSARQHTTQPTHPSNSPASDTDLPHGSSSSNQHGQAGSAPRVASDMARGSGGSQQVVEHRSAADVVQRSLRAARVLYPEGHADMDGAAAATGMSPDTQPPLAHTQRQWDT